MLQKLFFGCPSSTKKKVVKVDMYSNHGGIVQPGLFQVQPNMRLLAHSDGPSDVYSEIDFVRVKGLNFPSGGKTSGFNTFNAIRSTCLFKK